MPYIGLKLDLSKAELTVKLHGPVIDPQVNTVVLKHRCMDILSGFKVDNYHEVCIGLATGLRDMYCDGINIVWAQVDLEVKSNGVLFGSSAEKVKT